MTPFGDGWQSELLFCGLRAMRSDCGMQKQYVIIKNREGRS